MKKQRATAKGAAPVKRAPTSSAWSDHGPVEDVYARISTRAHELYVQRGYVDGYHLHDWLEAEQEILGRAEESDRTSVRL